MLTVIRSTLYMLCIVPITIVYGLFGFMVIPFPPRVRYAVLTTWSIFAMWLLDHVVGLRYRVIGRENLPDRPAVILCKHQSAWETISVQRIFPPVSFVAKRELLFIPFFGWALAQMCIIAIDRKAGKDALQQVIKQGKGWLEKGFWVVIFPEGTRSVIGTARRYKIGGASLAAASGAPIVPVAHNAGEFWGRNAFLKRAGEITLSIGPVIETQGRSAEELNAQVEAWIEGEMHRLFPHHYTGAPAKTGA